MCWWKMKERKKSEGCVMQIKKKKNRESKQGKEVKEEKGGGGFVPHFYPFVLSFA